MRIIPLLFSGLTSLASFASPAVDALHLDWVDKNTAIDQNFYSYANGTWQTQHPIPADYPSWSTFHALNEITQHNIHQLLKTAAANRNAKPGSIEQKVGDFYFSGMNESAIDAAGITPLAPEFDRINAIQSSDEMQAELAHLHLMSINALFCFGSMQDFKDSTKVIAATMQGGLSLPDRDYYISQDKRFKEIRAIYRSHLSRMFQLLGDDAPTAASEANTVIRIETALAQASLSQTAQRDPHAIYHVMSTAELSKITPLFSWPNYFKAMGRPNIQDLNVGMPDFMKAFNQQLKQVSMSEWKVYLRWNLLHAFAPYLSKPFVDENFQLARALTGTQTLMPRWKRVVDTEDSALGFAVGELYVKHYFSATDKRDVLDMVNNIRDVLRDDLKTLPWMTPATRKAALKKLSLMEVRIGYPDQWWDYSTLKIDRNSYALNVLRVNQFLVKRDLNKIGRPVDRTEWEMSPQTINAYYNPSMNSINFPAGILQAPFFDSSAPAAVNYGSIGFVIGHEITHGFDDQGAKFDGRGNLHDWWTAEDLKKFNAATQCIVNQFSKYRVAGNLPVNGPLVVGEATADLGGLTLAYHAFHASDAYHQAPTIHGFTPDQQFFLGAAHVWANNMRPEKALHLITTDPHPPAMYRVNGSLANMPAFQAAFDLSNDSPMVNVNRCVIW
jgi:putative endopeptidase